LEEKKIIPIQDLGNDPEGINYSGSISKKELCLRYRISRSTLQRWIRQDQKKFEALGLTKSQQILNPKQVALCFELWGVP
jgi:transposase-like protein